MRQHRFDWGFFPQIIQSRKPVGTPTLAHARMQSDLIQRHGEVMIWQWDAVNATDLIHTRHRGGRPTVLGRAIGELARIDQTHYLLANWMTQAIISGGF